MSSRFRAGRVGKTQGTSATDAPGIWGMEQATSFKRDNAWIRNVASGGNVDAQTPGNGYVYHVFTSPGYFTIPADFPASQAWDVLLVAGGGTGAEFGASKWCGGWRGGVVHHEQLNATGVLTVTIGVGGGPVGGSVKDDGDDSTIVSPTGPWTITQGGGVVDILNAGNPGGSGGGGGGYGGNYSNVHAHHNR